MAALWYWICKYVLVGPTLRARFRPTITGTHHIPRTGPAILAGNHLAVVDSFLLVLMVRRRITFVAKSEYFTGRGMTGRLKRAFFLAAGQVPIPREDAAGAHNALATAQRILESGGLWGIYPEGTRSPDGRLYRGKTGAMRVAQATGAPVLPVVVRNTGGPGHRRRVHITVCPPMDLSALHGQGDPRAAVRHATDDLMRALRHASGQEYVDVYASEVKAGRGTA